MFHYSISPLMYSKNRMMASEAEIQKRCFLCLKKAISTCDKCPVSFCSNTHRILHQDDRGNCFPYQIENRDGIGRVRIMAKVLCKPHFDKTHLVKGRWETGKSKSARIGPWELANHENTFEIWNRGCF